MRAFVAVELPPSIKELLYNFQKQISNEHVKIKWVAKKNLHLTLKFFSEISVEKIEKIKEKLSSLKFEPFKVKLGELSFFPSEDSMKVIWVGLENFKKILDIQGDIELKIGNLYPQSEKFSVHLTLGRIKLIKNKKKFLDSLKDVKIENVEFEIDELVLLKSVLTKDGPKYTTIGKF
jgi:2'-5' RNA ligase